MKTCPTDNYYIGPQEWLILDYSMQTKKKNTENVESQNKYEKKKKQSPYNE